MKEDFISVRMHSSLHGNHHSGAERLCGEEELEDVSRQLLQRALSHERGQADKVFLRFDSVPSRSVCHGCLPDMQTIEVDGYREGRAAARELLQDAGVSACAASMAVNSLSGGAAPGGANMRGAMLVDAETGLRRESDPARGVRAKGMDISPDAEKMLRMALEPRGLDNDHVREAMVLAAKVISTPGIIAELCWSDDPSYTAGYVASANGYQRLTHLKPAGDELGGRAFFVRPQSSLAEIVDYLENSFLLVTELGRFLESRRWTGDPDE